MNAVNAPEIEAAIWERVGIEGTLTPAAARAMLKVQFPQSDHERMRQLSAKARSGALAPKEAIEIGAYERLGCLLDILHSQARRALKKGRNAS